MTDLDADTVVYASKLGERLCLPTEIWFEAFDVDDERIKPLTMFRSLRVLFFAGDAQITDAAAATIAKLNNLRRVRLPNSFSDAGLLELACLSHLEELAVGDNVTDDGLVALLSMPRLQRIDLSRSRVTSTGVQQMVANNLNLRRLDLSWRNDSFDDTGFEDEWLTAIGTLSKLERLSLRFRERLTDDGLKYLSRLANLEALDVSCSSVNGSGFSDLLGLNNLCYLDLSGCPIDDMGMAQIRKLPRLKHLDVTGTKLSKECLSQLLADKQLRVDVRGKFPWDERARNEQGTRMPDNINLPQ